MSMNLREETIRANFRYFGGVSIAYGLLFAFCIYRNLFGATFLLYAAATVYVLVLFLHKIELKIKREVWIYFAAVILCGLSTCITGNRMFQCLNWCCVIGLLLLAMLRQFFDESRWEIGSYIRNAAALFFSTVGHSFLPAAEAKRYVRGGRADSKRRRYTYLMLAGIGAAIGSLVIILPLLMSSDRIFGQVFGKVFSLFRFEEMLPNLWTAFGMVFTAFAGFALIYAFFYASCRAAFPEERDRLLPTCHAVTGISFAAVIGGIYVLYSGIQMVYLFGGNDGRLPAGITYSEYAREGFWQLMAVACLNIIMVLICKYLFEEHKVLRWLLTVICGCTFIMTASAAYRMYLYVEAYYLSFLRILVFWALFLLTCIMAVVVVSIYKKNFPLVHYMILIAVGGHLLFSFARPEYAVAKYNVNHMEKISEIDLNYMLYGLSVDAAPVIADLEPGDIDVGDDELALTDVKGRMYVYFRQIAEENEDIYFRKANYSRIRAKQAADMYLTEHESDWQYAIW